MANSTFYLGENAQSFKTSPKFAVFDMVILNLDENTYISSPYAQIDQTIWEAESSRKVNGTFVFAYDPDSETWKLNGSEVTLADYGITVTYNVAAAAAKAGDTITVRRFASTDTGDVKLDIELTRSGRTLETNCPLVKPSQRQDTADRILESVCKYQYQPFSASAAEVNPLMELGDGITVHGVYSGMFQQDLEFNSMMTSDVGAPAEEETESEYNYETASERRYSRHFADIAAELSIHSDEISAKVERVGTGNGFSWSLIESAFTVKKGNTEVFRVDGTGAHVKGEITAETGYIGTEARGFAITASAIMNGMTSLSDTENNGIYIGTDGMAFGQGKFKVTSGGVVTMRSGSINLGEIRDAETGEVTDYRFKVDSNGNLYATSGTFSGYVKASMIQTGANDGYISGSMFSGGSIGASHIANYSLGTGKFLSGVNTSLGYADFANDVFNNRQVAGWIEANLATFHSLVVYPKAPGFLGYYGKWQKITDGNGTDLYVWARGDHT